MHHDLKILTTYFPAVLDGSKPFEIRDNSDRNFQQGDTVTLNEWDGERYTGRSAKRLITFVTDYAQQPGYVVFGMKELPEPDEKAFEQPSTIYFMAGVRETKTGEELAWMTGTYPDSMHINDVMADMRIRLMPPKSDFQVIVTAFNAVKSIAKKVEGHNA
ncbi:DUF3850 domain-containing protein [Aeromonas salmonicida]|uniref:DUF3850 domain-containing protein n=1 Tax=Aeromonas salmonicida TaxID=645 RepID=UPI000A113AE6|nr:DUF3850 domain-containing protein [Aeromonas salmonicida]WCH30697.1 DUF3850 domain-containing protein [Aeromonas salmonicida]WCH34893.1 DUF3850 domain-containing protein [Aeromonas salmonicida]WGI38385.1 DUF3850 domain-containing protein [Aeromonas salmonicida]